MRLEQKCRSGIGDERHEATEEGMGSHLAKVRRHIANIRYPDANEYPRRSRTPEGRMVYDKTVVENLNGKNRYMKKKLLKESWEFSQTGK